MKRILWLMAWVGVVAVAGIWLARRNHSAGAPGAPMMAASPVVVGESNESPAPFDRANPVQGKTPSALTTPQPAPANAAPTPLDGQTDVRSNVDRLLSTQISFEEKYHLWLQLRDQGKLDAVIADLNERATNNPAAAEYPAALGQAYLHKIAVTKDTRDYAVLGALADRSFDTALDIDPAHWDARFFKATAMSYWPEEMNKRPEVIQRFTQLIQDQEAQPPQAQFAQSYYWLGETYQKAGRSDAAEQTWRRGAALFPNDPMLQQKLAGK